MRALASPLHAGASCALLGVRLRCAAADAPPCAFCDPQAQPLAPSAARGCRATPRPRRVRRHAARRRRRAPSAGCGPPAPATPHPLAALTARGCAPPAQDPENILRPPEIGAINRRTYTRKLMQDADFLKQARQRCTRQGFFHAFASSSHALLPRWPQEEKRLAAVKAETAAARDARVVPTEPRKLVEFLLSTTADEMDFELVRVRPQLTPAFFDDLRSAIRDEKFSPRSSADRLAELEGLMAVAEAGAAKADAAVAQLTAPADRLRKLLNAPDKKAMILEMAAENELDEPFMALLEQNIDGAREAGQKDASLFLEKLRNACRKFAKVAPTEVLPPVSKVGGSGIDSISPANSKIIDV